MPDCVPNDDRGIGAAQLLLGRSGTAVNHGFVVRPAVHTWQSASLSVQGACCDTAMLKRRLAAKRSHATKATAQYRKFTMGLGVSDGFACLNCREHTLSIVDKLNV
jgi:hypothetical protein